jgi:hypothetical protein
LTVDFIDFIETFFTPNRHRGFAIDPSRGSLPLRYRSDSRFRALLATLRVVLVPSAGLTNQLHLAQEPATRSMTTAARGPPRRCEGEAVVALAMSALGSVQGQSESTYPLFTGAFL